MEARAVGSSVHKLRVDKAPTAILMPRNVRTH